MNGFDFLFYLLQSYFFASGLWLPVDASINAFVFSASSFIDMRGTETALKLSSDITPAGKELVTEGVISEESFKAVSVPLMSMKELAENTNAFIDASTGSQRPEAKK